jgi:hypothetical protein
LIIEQKYQRYILPKAAAKKSRFSVNQQWLKYKARLVTSDFGIERAAAWCAIAPVFPERQI